MYVLIIVNIGKQELSHKYNTMSAKHGSKNCVQAYYIGSFGRNIGQNVVCVL
jgi:hypothetical protein